ncbi:hypothetical protein LCGC14_2525340 [marine sediment metagenome]|uniref:Uncharacterized protein n=1 Tax=marine sediment metagenome TaxID=412755 RepID=A0A0F9D6P5_9ZZZZ
MSGWGSHHGAEDLENKAILGFVFLVASIVGFLLLVFK